MEDDIEIQLGRFSDQLKIIKSLIYQEVADELPATLTMVNSIEF